MRIAAMMVRWQIKINQTMEASLRMQVRMQKTQERMRSKWVGPRQRGLDMDNIERRKMLRDWKGCKCKYGG